MKTRTATEKPESGKSGYHLYGAVRDKYQRPLRGVVVKAFDKDIRSEQPLGKPIRTDEKGYYKIHYTHEQFARTDKLAADVVVRVYGRAGKLLKESDIYYNAPAKLEVDIDLSEKPYTRPSEFEKTVESVKPFIGRFALTELAEDDNHQDITFLTNKTDLPRTTVEALAMAFRFERNTKIEASAFYGLIRQGPPNNMLAQAAYLSSATNFDSEATQTFDMLMRESIDALMNSLQGAINSNVIPYWVTASLKKIKQQLLVQQRLYLKKHPQPQGPSPLTTKLPLSQLTVEQAVLTDQLIKSQEIKSPADFRKLATYTSDDWQRILQSKKIKPPSGIPGQNNAERVQNHAVHLEQTFTARFPHAAFTARIQNDAQSKIPNASKIAQFLSNNPNFDLLTTRIGQYLQSTTARARPSRSVGPTPTKARVNPKAAVRTSTSGPSRRNVASPTVDAEFMNQLKRTQRIFKLAPTYAATNLLLGDGIHSAHKVYRMGRGNFVAKYGPQLGVAESEQIFQKATQAHSQALMLLSNLKSMSDASYLNVFPDYTTTIADAMTVEVPDLDTLFGHTDFCECEECRSIYGAAAYLTDILHYLDRRLTSISYGPGEYATVKQALLRRRPDIGDIDLECRNVNTEIPHIDKANEIMEDFIAPPQVIINASFLPKFVAGPIDGGLLTEIINHLNNQSFDLSNVANLLTANATISEQYQAERLQDDDTLVTENHWIIRDQFVVLKATDLGPSGISVQLLHQTLLSSDDVSANPEYVNIPAYNALRTANRPFSLPFDLFETEGELYLEKLGTKKVDLIDAFRQEHQPIIPPTQATQSDLDMAYAYLKINETERTLIFQQDLNQTTYWGNLAAGTSVELDVFMNVTGLDYGQVLELLNLNTINPLRDSVILSDDVVTLPDGRVTVGCDTTKKHVTNLTPINKFDIIHRFLRLWKKTSFTLEELDAIVQAPVLGNGNIGPSLAWQLQAFMQLQDTWSLSAFQLLAFYQDLDTTPVSADSETDNLYNQFFQNRAVTNPLNPDFAIAQVQAGASTISDTDKGVITGALGVLLDDLSTLIAKTDGKLSLHNLSYFYRISQLAQALSLSVSDLLIVMDLINIPACADATLSVPSDPVTTAKFFSKWQTIVSSGFSTGELNYVLRHQNDATRSLITSDDLVATALADLQSKLLQIQATTSVQDDPSGQLLKKWLTDPLLNWNSHIVDKLMDILGTQDNDEYQQKLVNNSDTTLNQANDFLINLRIQYLYPQNGNPLLLADLSQLPPIPIPPNPPGTTFPDLLPGSLASQISYDGDNKKLQLIGYMNATDETAVAGIFTDPAYQAAVTQLFNAQQTSNDPSNIFFATKADVTNGIGALSVPDRYKWFLSIISPVYAAIQQQNTVQAEICSWFKINKDVAAAIEASQPGIYTDFTDPVFVSKVNPLTAANYPNQFNWYQKIAKICFIATKLKLTADDLTWLFAHSTDINSLDFWNLPITPVPGPVPTSGPVSFDSFEVVINILKFEQKFPAIQQVTSSATNTVSVYSIIEDVTGGKKKPVQSLATFEMDLCSLTGWNQTQLDQLINAPNTPNYLNLSAPPLANPPIPSPDLKDVHILLRLQRCFDIMNQLGVAVADCIEWAKQPSLSPDDTAKIKQTLKAQTGSDQWLSVSQPPQDTLRQAKRDALVAYLIANPPPGQTWTDSDDLYDYFLIDPEICPCQPTSRIVQATVSVQQFVERCFLHLEQDINVDLTLDPEWAQWEWMKQFRLWQANVKVFLYPENWIEPELLPTEIKSPFFKELENDLLQNDVTIANTETAFLNYLDKLDGVSRLEIKAMCYEDQKKTLHVVGRTYGGDPKTYYYRQFIDNRRWTPWVKIDQDIASDHIVLTVFNHRIYLFWAIFSEKSDEVTDVTIPDTSQAKYTVDKPYKYWQIQMAFTEYKNSKWTPKIVSNADSTGTITVTQHWEDQSWWDPSLLLPTYVPPKKDFIFTPLDIPDFNIAKEEGVAASLSGNGDLQIHCFLQYGPGKYDYQGTFDLDPCKGYPVCTWSLDSNLTVTLFDQSQFFNMLDAEQSNASPAALSVFNVATILSQTPTQFNNLIPLQMGFADRWFNIWVHSKS